jgi:hypothetical protein
MKKAIPFLPYTLCVAVVLLVVSCSKSGDAGPAGPAGAAGAAGPAGPAGTAGAAGTANVIYSSWIDTAIFIADTIHTGTIIDTIGYFTNLNVPKLDLDMLNKGEIKVYVNAVNATAPLVFPLPYNDGSLFIDPIFYLNTIQLYSNADLTDIVLVRYILIPGGTPARSAKSIDWNNYKEVQKYLGLTD